MAYVLGIDAGASKTAAVVLDQEGRERGRGSSGPANYHTIGPEAAVTAFNQAGQQALEAAGLAWSDLAAFCLGAAGVDRPDDIARLRPLLSPFAPRIHLTNDAVVALIGGLGHAGAGVVIIAGTGANIYGQDGTGSSARASGWGYVMDDEGSGYWIGRAALQAVMRAFDSRDEPTLLRELILERFNLSDPPSLVGIVYAPGFGVSQIASLAQTVLAAAEQGDRVAHRILRQAGRELALAATTVLRRLGLLNQPVEVVTCGGLIKQPTLLRQILVESLTDAVPAARPIFPAYDAATGAALLALEFAHHD